MLGAPLLLGDDGYQISRSVRLRSSASAFFNRTPASASNQQKFTWSGWVKRGQLGAQQKIFFAGASSSNFASFEFVSGDNFQFFAFNGSTNAQLVTSQVFRDPSSWYHIVFAVDSAQATSSERIKLYINGAQVTAFSTSTYPTQNFNFPFNNTVAHAIGRDNANANNYLDGYLTEINFIDGQALTPSSFGETDAITGVWKPKKYAGTYGTNGFYLNFSDNSSNTATTIGKDYSGNGNNWTPNNISVTAGSTYDSMLDVPTLWADGGNGRGNYAIVNPLSKGTSQTNVIDGNLYAIPTSGGSNWGTVFSSIAIPTSGKWYIEGTAQVYTGSGNNSSLGVVDSSTFIPTNTAILYQYTTGEGFDGILAHLFSDYVAPISDGVQGTNVTGLTGTSINLMLALDVDNGKVYAGYNGTWLNSGNPAGNTGEVATRSFSSNDVVAGHTSWNGSNDQSQYFNFGQRPFTYTPPTGFKALNTQNLPEPTIKKGNQYFDISLYTGNAGSITVTNAGFQPDLVWIKARSSAFDNKLVDAVRGASGGIYYDLSSNSTGAESLPGAGVNGLTSTGFTIGGGTNNGYNGSGTTFAAWQWKEGATQGFDIVTYTGNGTAGRTISHSLGVAPAMTIVKDRSNGTNGWPVWHRAYAGTQTLYLESTTGLLTRDRVTAVSSTTFTVGSHTEVNNNGNTYVAYLFSEVAGFSKFGSYTGNGSSDGPFVYTGFRPRWVMTKRTDSAGSWLVVDSARNTYNVVNGYLVPNTSDAEGTATWGDFTSNGFKLRGTTHNGSGESYIYAAFAENPFKLSLAR